MLLVALLGLTLAAVGFLSIPFLRPSRPSPEGSGAVAALARELDDVKRDEDAGHLDAASAATIRVEVERRLLDAADLAQSSGQRVPPAVDRVVAIGVSGIVVIGAAILFAVTGRPELAGASRGNSVAQAAVAQSAPTDLPDVDTMIGRLAERLKANPGDAEGWRMLGWSNFQTQQYREAADAYQHALSIEPRNAGFQSALGEARLMADGGRVGPEALAMMRKALALDPKDERAQFYIGLSRSQNQDARGALDVWLAALGRSPAGSEWNAQFRDHAVSLAREKGIDIAARLPPAPPSTPPQIEAGSFAPSADGVAQVRALASSDQEAAIAGMVEGLDQKLVANPRDADGWKRLMRARMVLGQPDRARSALDRALAAYADDASAQREIRAAATELGVPAR